MLISLNIGDIYALLAAICWSSGVILFELSGSSSDVFNMSFTFLPNSIFCISIHIRSPEICVKPLALVFIASNVSLSHVGLLIRP